MLQAVGKARRIENNVIRQWFMNEEIDLILFMNPDQSLHQFQLSYDKLYIEKLLVWDEDHGFSHGCIDDGQEVFGRAKTPVVISCQATSETPLNLASVSEQFHRSGKALPESISQFILHKLAELNTSAAQH